MATTSKEGSRRVNYSVPIRRGSDDKYRCHEKFLFNSEEEEGNERQLE